MPSNLMPLKAIVISLGLVLLGGFAVIIGTILSKQEAGKIICAPKNVKLPYQGKLLGVIPMGNNWGITIHTEDNSIIAVTLDACTGTVLSAIDIK